jgi:hypothetical protein
MKKKKKPIKKKKNKMKKKMTKYTFVINLFVWEKCAIFIFYNPIQRKRAND